jgi:hypothetical protein
MTSLPAGSRLLAPLLAAGLALLLAPQAPAQSQGEQPELPTELWQEYPLDPSRGGEDPAEQSEEGGSPATTVERPAAPRGGEKPAVTAPETDGGGLPWLLLIAVTLGVSAALGIAFGVVRARRRGVVVRLVVAVRLGVGSRARAGVSAGRRAVGSLAGLAAAPVGVVSTAAKWRPSRGVVERLRAEMGELAPLAEPEPRRQPQPRERARPSGPPPPTGKKPVRPAGAPPAKEELPGLSPPPHKRRTAASGLPPEKSAEPLRRARPATRDAPRVPRRAPDPVAAAPQPRAAQPAEPRPLRAIAPRWEECEIGWWRGFVKSEFYAVARPPDGGTYVAARSPTFRWWRSEPPPEEGSGAEEHAQLLAELVEAGWEPVGQGIAWYETRLRRRVRPPLRELARLL